MTISTAGAPSASPPRAVQIVRGLLVLMALYHLGFPLLELSETRLGGAKLIQTAAQNGFLLVLTAMLIWKLPTGHRWALRPATFSQLLTIVTGAIMWPAASDLVAIDVPADALSMTIILLLWVPASSRTFFARGRHTNARATPAVL